MSDKRMSRWYFGGLASCGAACCTHPLDLIKVSAGERTLEPPSRIIVDLQRLQAR